MNKATSKLLYGLIALMQIILLWWIYTGIFGNPIEKISFRMEVNKYLSQTYPNQDYQIKEITNNFKNYDCTAVVESKSDESERFIIAKMNVNVTNTDTEVRKIDYYYEYKYEKELRDLFSEEVHGIKIERIEASMHLWDPTNANTTDIYRVKEGMYILLDWSKTDLYEDDFFVKTLAIKDKLMTWNSWSDVEDNFINIIIVGNHIRGNYVISYSDKKQLGYTEEETKENNLLGKNISY